MAEHGGGGGSKKKGVVGTVAGNGCLRYLALYLIALFLVIGGLAANALHLIHLPGLSASASSNATTQSASLPAAPSGAQNTAPASNATQPANNTGAAQGGGTNGAQGGGSAQVAPIAVINREPVAGGQGGLITPYFAPAFYIVHLGDTLDTIAATYGTTAANLKAYNQLSNDTLQAGQVLYLPPVAYNPVPNTGRNAGHDSAPAANPNDANGNPH